VDCRPWDHHNTADARESSMDEFFELAQLDLSSQQHGIK
jgi:hypothetical protein